MIQILIRGAKCGSDAFALVKAFFPEEEILPETGEEMGENRYQVLVRRDGERIAEAASGGEDGGTPVAVRNALKRKLYLSLSEYCGRDLPWGTLTGIRPAKIGRDLMEKGISEDNAAEVLRQFYCVSDEKTALAMEIAKREIRILSRTRRSEGYSLYVGIPFCPTTCLYCSFTSFPINSWKERTGVYLEAVARELDAVAELFPGRILDTVYIGGGTPTTLEPSELSGLIRRLRDSLDLKDLKEFTVEAGRPDSITPEKLAALRENGVSRISVNPQTMNDRTLRLIGRQHTAARTEEAFRMAREAGFDNINMDMILGLPEETEEDVKRTVEAVGALGPDSLTVHSLAVKRASRLNQVLSELDHDSLRNTDETMAIAAGAARGMGMVPYYLYRQKNMAGNFENTGYARPGKEGLYNVLIMEEVQDIVAVGAGTVSKHVSPLGKITRCDTSKDVEHYMEHIDEMIRRKRALYGADSITG